ncbi:MAG: hypothetical protein B7Z26_09520 [Asticcacaulis sp. 32-58-5]|nr:MAG: hypothetical protein B7Z26_09520 [Asticcacaulis sp. 32-58-5]
MAELLFKRDEVRGLVEDFYGRVRADDLIGPVFNGAVHDWPEHFDNLTLFWMTITNGPHPDIPNYKGRPMAKHFPLDLNPAMFERWLELWVATTGERFDALRAEILREKAYRIGQSFQAALFFKPVFMGKGPG